VSCPALDVSRRGVAGEALGSSAAGGKKQPTTNLENFFKRDHMRFIALRLWACLAPFIWPMHRGPGSYCCISSSGSSCLSVLRGGSISHHVVYESLEVGPFATKLLMKLLMKLKLLLVLLTHGGGFLRSLHRDAWHLLRGLPRTIRVCTWAVQAGLAYKSLKASFNDHESEAYLEQLSLTHTKWAVRLAGVCRANGGVYVKFGQFAVCFGGVPREYRVLLAQLEDKARPMPYSSIQRVLLSQLGLRKGKAKGQLIGAAGSGAVFSEFEEEATAAASLAQVHRARLSTGEQVAVKLQYPGLKAVMRADLSIMKTLSFFAQFAFPEFHLGWMFGEMESKLKFELNFLNEIQNANKLCEILKSNKLPASIPYIHSDLSSERMIIMEWIEVCGMEICVEYGREK
jgi:hypothetical protein